MPDSHYLIPIGDDDHAWQVDDELSGRDSVSVRPPSSYRHAFGDNPIRLGLVEFRILLFLASRPYHAFTRRQIVDALAADSITVDQAAVDGHITTLRDQLGILGDFVQTVPHVGFRYKA